MSIKVRRIFSFQETRFRDFAARYLAYSETNKAPATYRRHDLNNMRPLTAFFGGMKLRAVTPVLVEKYKRERLACVAPATVNRELATLRHMYTKAAEWGYVRVHPLKGVTQLKEPPGRVRYLREEEIGRLLGCCAAHVLPIVVAALHTGMRKGELLGLRWERVDLERRRITVLHSKNNEVRSVPVNRTLYGVLEELGRKGRSGHVFRGPDGKALGDIKKGFAGAVRRAGIEDFRFHDLRHTFASYMVMSGVDLRTVQQVLGHTELKTTLRYSHLSTRHVQESVEKLDGVMGRRGDGVME